MMQLIAFFVRLRMDAIIRGENMENHINDPEVLSNCSNAMKVNTLKPTIRSILTRSWRVCTGILVLAAR